MICKTVRLCRVNCITVTVHLTHPTGLGLSNLTLLNHALTYGFILTRRTQHSANNSPVVYLNITLLSINNFFYDLYDCSSVLSFFGPDAHQKIWILWLTLFSPFYS